jgi:hypothetical protein
VIGLDLGFGPVGNRFACVVEIQTRFHEKALNDDGPEEALDTIEVARDVVDAGDLAVKLATSAEVDLASGPHVDCGVGSPGFDTGGYTGISDPVEAFCPVDGRDFDYDLLAGDCGVVVPADYDVRGFHGRLLKRL